VVDVYFFDYFSKLTNNQQIVLGIQTKCRVHRLEISREKNNASKSIVFKLDNKNVYSIVFSGVSITLLRHIDE